MKELFDGEYTIPEGYIANIENDKIIVKKEESEDERIIHWIKKELEAKYVIDNIVNNVMADKALAWLEEQGEQNPYSGVSFKYNGHTWGMCARDNGVDILLDKQLFKHLEKQDEQKPAWSEEDERLCSCLIEEQEESLDNVRNDKYGHSEIISDLKEMYNERIDWLKSIKDRVQPQWKPSEEELNALDIVKDRNDKTGWHLCKLYKQLKKL